jgi:hypothetical protein
MMTGSGPVFLIKNEEASKTSIGTEKLLIVLPFFNKDVLIL